MKKNLHSLILLILLNSSFLLQAQWQNGLWTEKQAYNWHFGFQAGINFNTTPPTAITDSAIDGYLLNPNNPDSTVFLEGTGSISDADGNLLFYTNGMTVWNANNEIMLNGEGLQTTQSTYQTGLIVPAPGNSGIYYIFTSGQKTSPNGAMVYSEVDMSLDGGLGAITENKNVQIAPAVEERMTAVHHADGQGVWVVFNTYSSNTNEIQAVLVSNEGVSSTPVLSSIGTAYLWAGQGAMKFSPDGSKMAMSRLVLDTYFIEIFKFDNATGQLTELLATIDYNDIVGNYAGVLALEFSPNNKYLYACSLFEGTIHQLDLEAGSEQDIKDSRTVVHQSLTDAFFFMQLAPDGKIYLSSYFNPSAPYLSVINFPNNKGIACGFTENSFDLAGNQNQSSLPCLIQSYFGSGILYEGGDCPGEDISFSTLRIAGIESIVWDFGDPESGGDNISTELEPTHTFSAGGIYTVTATITSNGAQQTTTTQVTVLPAPEIAVPDASDLIQCAGIAGTSVFDLTELDIKILNGLDATQFTVTYYASEADVIAENPIAAPDSFSTIGQTIYAKIININTGCSSVISLDLVVNPLPLITTPDDMQQCSDSQTAIFNLTQQNATILGAQDPNSFMVNYYANESDITDNNPIGTPESFTASSQVVYAVVTNTVTGCTSDSVEFDIDVIVTSLNSDILELTGCSPINLNDVASQLGSGLILSFYTQEEQALINENAITDVERYMANDNITIVYVRAEDTQGCADVYRLQLSQENCTIPRGISPNNDGMNDNFDLTYLNVKQLNVFNRYGKNVYSRKNYTSEWYGQSNNGNELPTGTYYYMIETGEGETITGWVYINRQE